MHAAQLILRQFFIVENVPLFQIDTHKTLLAVFIFVSIDANASSPPKCDFSNEKSPLVITRITNLDIQGAELAFPQDYLFSQHFRNNSERGALLLRADTKDFSSYPRAKGYLPNGRSKISAGVRDYMQILITSYIPLPQILNNTLANKYKEFRYTDGPVPPISSESVRFGLSSAHGYTSEGYLKDDVFFVGNDTDITDVILCSTERQVPLPSCSHIFEVDAYDVKISYSREELPRWKELRRGVAKLLRCFTTKEPTQLP